MQFPRSDEMSPLTSLDAIGLEDLALANVAQVISRSQIERLLGRSIELVETAGHFAEISASLAA